MLSFNFITVILCCQTQIFERISASLCFFWLNSNVSNDMGTTEPMLCTYFQQPAWWLGPTPVQAFHRFPAEMPARHSELAAPPIASLMTSAACKTPGSGADAQEEKDRSRWETGGIFRIVFLLRLEKWLNMWKMIALRNDINVNVRFWCHIP